MEKIVQSSEATSLFEMRINTKEHKSRIAALDQLLSEYNQ
jgi:hypothetical protein